MTIKKRIEIVLRAIAIVEMLLLFALPMAAFPHLSTIKALAAFGALVPVVVPALLLADHDFPTRVVRWLRCIPLTRYIAAGCVFVATFFVYVAAVAAIAGDWGNVAAVAVAVALVSGALQFLWIEDADDAGRPATSAAAHS